MWLLYLTLLRYFAAPVAAAAVIAAWFGTNALHYTAVDLMMSHAAALFSTAWCGYEAVTLAESPASRSKWCRVGISCALVGLVRYQNVVFLLVPAAAMLAVLAHGTPRRMPSACLLDLSCAAIGFLVAWLPQLAAWKAMFGSWIVNSYQREFAFAWMHPHILDVLVRDPTHGLALWLPLLGIGMLGCAVLALRRGDVVALSAVVAWVLNLYVISAWWAWDSVAQRSTFDFLLPIGLGAGAALTAVRGKLQSAVCGGLALLVVWSVPFAAIGVPDTLAAGTMASSWLECVKALL
jgi:hypothetical protein